MKPVDTAKNNQGRYRLKDLGIAIGDLPTGPLNAITDVADIEVGHVTIIKDGDKTIRTGLTSILPKGRQGLWKEAVFAGSYVLNGYGEMTGRSWLEESGLLSSPICLTSFFGIGETHKGVVQLCDDIKTHSKTHPVVAETFDGWLSDETAFAINPEHAREATDNARSGPVEEGNVGGGTGMCTHDFKGGIGTSSRVIKLAGKEYTLGVLVQSNYGDRADLRIDGVPVGKYIGDKIVPIPERKQIRPEEDGSIIVVIATDAPLLPIQCDRLARRGALGLARVGGFAHGGSGDYFIAFSTANVIPIDATSEIDGIKMLPQTKLDSLFHATVEATEEAILNSLCMAETMTGQQGRTVHEMPLELVRDIVLRHRFNQHDN